MVYSSNCVIVFLILLLILAIIMTNILSLFELLTTSKSACRDLSNRPEMFYDSVSRKRICVVLVFISIIQELTLSRIA